MKDNQLIRKTNSDTPQFKPIRKTRVADEAVVQLTNLILGGAYPAGSKLPAERELAQQMGINRTSLREALRKLETMGLINIRPGDGVFVQDYNLYSGLEFVKFLLANGIGLDKDLMLSMAETRRLFVQLLIEMAVDRAEDADLEALLQVAERYPSHDPYERLTGQWDFRFFQQLALATKNKIFVYVLNTVREVIEQTSVIYYQMENQPELAGKAYLELARALKARQKKKALALIKKRMEGDDALLAKVLEGME